MKKQFYFLFLTTSFLFALPFNCSATDPDTVTQQFVEKLQAQSITELPYDIFSHFFDTLIQEEEYYAFINSLSDYEDTTTIFAHDSILVRFPKIKDNFLYKTGVRYAYANPKASYNYSRPFFYTRFPPVLSEQVEVFISLTKIYNDKQYRGVILFLHTYDIKKDELWSLDILISESCLEEYCIPHLEGFRIDTNYRIKIGRYTYNEEYTTHKKETWYRDKCVAFFDPDWETVEIDYRYDAYDIYPNDCED